MNVNISADTRSVTDGCSAPGMWPASNSAGERTSMVSTRGLHLKASKFPILGTFRRFLCLLDLIGILLCFLYLHLQYPVSFDVNFPPFGHLRLNSARAARPSERRDSNERRQRQRHWRGAQGALLSWTIQGFQKGLSDTMLNWDKSWPFQMLSRLSRLYHLMPRPQCSKIWLLSGVKLRKSPKDASSYELFLSHGNSLLRKVMEALETRPSQDDATIWFHSMKPLTLTTKTRYKPVKKHGKPCRNDLLYKSNTEPGVGCLRVAATC